MDCGGSEFSDSGSSGYWSVGHAHGSPAPSPPITEPDAGPATPPDEGLDMELEQVLFDEPAPRKRRVSSVHLLFLWSHGRRCAHADAALPPAELSEGGVQVSVAQLWEGADVSGGN